MKIAFKILLCSAILALCVSAEIAHGQQLLFAASGSLGSDGSLYILDPNSGAVLETIGVLQDASGNPYGLTGLRYDASNGLLYGATTPASPTDPSYLVTVDPNTALVTPIGPFGTRVTDIAINPVTNLAYAVSGSEDGFYRIDLSTGIATAIGHTGTFPQNGGGLTANSSGMIFGTNTFSLYTYDITSGLATLVGGTGLSSYVRALAFSTEGTLFGIEGGAAGGDTGVRDLITINIVIGVATEVGTTVRNFDALAFVPPFVVPEPATVCLIFFAALIFLLPRLRRKIAFR